MGEIKIVWADGSRRDGVEQEYHVQAHAGGIGRILGKGTCYPKNRKRTGRLCDQVPAFIKSLFKDRDIDILQAPEQDACFLKFPALSSGLSDEMGAISHIGTGDRYVLPVFTIEKPWVSGWHYFLDEWVQDKPVMAFCFRQVVEIVMDW